MQKAVLFVGAAGGCAHTQDGNTNTAAVEAILKADRDFNQAVADGDLKQFLSFIAEGATFNGGTSDIPLAHPSTAPLGPAVRRR